MSDILHEHWEVRVGGSPETIGHVYAKTKTRGEAIATREEVTRRGWHVRVVHVVRRERGDARREALEEVRGYLVQCDDLKVYVADVVDEIDRLAKGTSR